MINIDTDSQTRRVILKSNSKLFLYYFPLSIGASLVGRIASWLAAIWTSMHSVIALLYVGMLSFKSVPFRECNKAVTINQQSIHVSHDVVDSGGSHTSEI